MQTWKIRRSTMPSRSSCRSSQKLTGSCEGAESPNQSPWREQRDVADILTGTVAGDGLKHDVVIGVEAVDEAALAELDHSLGNDLQRVAAERKLQAVAETPPRERIDDHGSTQSDVANRGKRTRRWGWLATEQTLKHALIHRSGRPSIREGNLGGKQNRVCC